MPYKDLEIQKQYQIEHRKKHKEKYIIYKKNWRIRNKEKISLENKTYKLLNRNKISEYRKKYYRDHKTQEQEYYKNKIKVDINLRLSSNLRKRVRLALKGSPKLSTTMNLVGCSIEFLKFYLESQFKDNMSWDNYGKWHIDHKIPCCAFDLSKEFAQRKCFHYTNLQPLWAEENLKKNRFKKSMDDKKFAMKGEETRINLA